MGKIESKEEKIIKENINCNIRAQIQCPICNKILNGAITYGQLNNHLRQCNFLTKKNLIQNDNNIGDNKTHRSFGIKNYEDMLDKKYINDGKSKPKSISLSGLINSEPSRKQKKSMNSTDKSNVDTFNDFQLVIDYNNTKNHDLYEEKLKNEGKKTEIYDKYSQLRKYLLSKKNLMNFDMNIECGSNKELFNALKNCNIYYNTKFILLKNDSNSPKSGKNKKPKVLNLNSAINKFIDKMLKNNIFFVIDNNLFFSFNTQEVDYEMIGVILSVLFIYPEIKLRYCVPLILCKILVNQRIELNDIKNINKELYNKLYDLTKDKNINNKNLVYFYDGNELLIDGKNIKVNNSNVYDYIDKIINYEMRKHKNEINIIKTNLFQLIPKKLIFSFNGEELYRIINRTL
jgi:hypothetical protein